MSEADKRLRTQEKRSLESGKRSAWSGRQKCLVCNTVMSQQSKPGGLMRAVLMVRMCPAMPLRGNDNLIRHGRGKTSLGFYRDSDSDYD